MEPYSWAALTAEEILCLRNSGSPYAFAQVSQPEWADILRETLMISGIAEAWIYRDDGALMVRFPEN